MQDQAVAGGSGAQSDESSGPAGGLLVRGLIAGVVVATLIALTFFVLWLQAADRSPEEQQREIGLLLEAERPEVQDVTVKVVDTLTTYDETNADQLRDRMAQVATGAFLDKFEQIAEGGLKEAIEQSSVSSRGRITSGPEISFESSSEAVAIATVTQTYQNLDNPTGATIDYVLKINLVNTEGSGWKADDVTLLSQQSS